MAAEAGPVRNPGLGSILKTTEGVEEQMEKYERHFQANDPETTEKRVSEASSLSDRFHTLVTDFYEYGFGESFHFCPLFRGRSFEDCIDDCEMYVSRKAKAGTGKKLAVRRVTLQPVIFRSNMKQGDVERIVCCCSKALWLKILQKKNKQLH